MSACSNANHKIDTKQDVDIESINEPTKDTLCETTCEEKISTTEIRSDKTTTNELVSTDINSPETDMSVIETNIETEISTYVTEVINVESIKEATEIETEMQFAETIVPEVTITVESKNLKAESKDATMIASRLIWYINTYRSEMGVGNASVLPGLTQYAEYRSRQLINNFAHDVIDERTAATALEYGECIDPIIFGMEGEPYYTANVREAILKTNYSGTVDQVAKHLAFMVRNSSDHWSYVGGERYSYIAIGVTYQGGTWYCDIAVTSVNTDK